MIQLKSYFPENPEGIMKNSSLHTRNWDCAMVYYVKWKSNILVSLPRYI